MVGANYQNDDERKLAGGEWILFCQKFNLTAPEIVEAYRMALAKELKIFDENKAYKSSEYNGEYIKIYPNLSLITAGEVLNAYLEHKKLDKAHENAKKLIHSELNPKIEISEEQKKAERKKNFESLIEAIKKNEPCNHAFLFYDFVIKKGGLKSFVSSKQAQIILIRSKMISYLDRAEKSGNKAIFNNFQIVEFRKYFDTGNLIPELASDFEKLKNIAIIEVKNDLVYAYLKKNLWKYNLKKSNNENS